MENKKIKVAIADDHTLIRKGIIELINSFESFELIIEAVNGRDLLEQLKQTEQLPDICLIDINMPELDGYETAHQLREQWENIKILALSMYENEHCIIKMLRSGANGYISKNMSPKALEQALFGVYHKFYFHSDLVSGRMINALHASPKNDLNIREREVEFLRLCISDLTYKEIAEKMCLSTRTVESYRDSLFEKLNLKTRAGLVVFAISIGLFNK